MRYPVLLMTLSLVFTNLSPLQKPVSTTQPETDFLAAGPFLFEPGAIHPTYMDAFDSRPVVASPDGKFAVTVTGPKESLGAWVTVTPMGFPGSGFSFMAWPIERNIDILWRPDSQAFALTDNRHADDSFVLVFGTLFNRGESGPELGVPITDLSPVIQKAFEDRAQKFYMPKTYDTDLSYIKVLRWMGNDQLLLGLNAKTSLPTPESPDMGIRDWYVGYLVDVPSKKVVKEFSEGELLSRYGIKVAK